VATAVVTGTIGVGVGVLMLDLVESMRCFKFIWIDSFMLNRFREEVFLPIHKKNKKYLKP